MISVRRRIMLWFVGLSVIGWVVTMLAVWSQVSNEVDEVYDAYLVQTARQLAATLSPSAAQEARDAAPIERVLSELSRPIGDNTYFPQLSAHIWIGNKAVYGGQDSGPPTEASGLHLEPHDDLDIRTYVLRDPTRDLTVEVIERHNARRRIIREVAQASLKPLLFLLPGIGLVGWLAVSGGLKPLKRLAQHIRGRASDDFRSVDLQQVPREVLALVEALNQLFERYHQVIERERRFTGDASHELRTPLAGLRVQAQLACRCDEEGPRRKALGQILVGIDRATHIVEQLLVLARLDPPQVVADMQQQALAPLLQEAGALLMLDAEKKSIGIEIAGGAAKVSGDAPMLLILMRNLLDNAIRYTPPGGRVRLSCGADGGVSWLQLDDSGPGIPARERRLVFKRFYRGDGRAEAGCGLGLSIVQRIAELHGADLDLGASPLGGLKVRVSFPERAAEAA